MKLKPGLGPFIPSSQETDPVLLGALRHLRLTLHFSCPTTGAMVLDSRHIMQTGCRASSLGQPPAEEVTRSHRLSAVAVM